LLEERENERREHYEKVHLSPANKICIIGK
jgi:hypothetical protein